MDTNRLLITGGSGMVGSQIPFGIKPSHAELDITDAESVAGAFDAYKPSGVIHCAALVDTVRPQLEPDVAERINVEGARHVAHAAARAGVPMLYLSTCTVFDGEKETPYIESDAPHPINVYGDTKYRGEEVVRTLIPNALIVRTGWLFGGFEKDSRFIHKFYDRLSAGEPLRATNDRFGSPTYVPDLVAEMMRLFKAGECGVVHVVNSGTASYYDVAVRIEEELGRSGLVEAAPSSELDAPGVRRGKMEGLASVRTELRPYTEALHDYISALKQTRHE